MCGATAFRSSTKASGFVIAPSMSSTNMYFCFLCLALVLRLMSKDAMIVCSTRAANIGLKGYP